jgi:TPR repeat protein
VPRDPVEAIKWFQQSAAAGNREAMLNLGKAYRDGVGVARDKAQADLWFQRAQK